MSEIKPFCYLIQTSSDRNPPHGWAVHFTDGEVPLYTADALSAARDAALEEAAKVCEANRDPESTDAYSHGWDQCAQTCADAIRALKDSK